MYELIFLIFPSIRCSHYQAIHSKELVSCSNVTHWEPDYSSPISEDGVTFRFGVIVCVGGLVGVVSGMITSVKLRAKEGFLISYFCSMFSHFSSNGLIQLFAESVY